MFFTDWRVLRRRWHAVLVGLLVTLGLGVAAALLVPPKYELRATMVLVPPKSPLNGGNNPFLSLGGLHDAADVLSRAMIDGAVHDSLVKEGADPDYIVQTDPTSAGPLILVIADGATPQAANHTLNVILDRLPVELTELQRSATVSASSLIDITEVSRDQAAKTMRKSQIRATVAAVGAGLVVTLFGTGLLDNFLRRRRSEPDDDEPAEPGPPAVTGARLDAGLLQGPNDRELAGDIWPLGSPRSAHETPSRRAAR